jgi:hypothetical protein
VNFGLAIDDPNFPRKPGLRLSIRALHGVERVIGDQKMKNSRRRLSIPDGPRATKRIEDQSGGTEYFSGERGSLFFRPVFTDPSSHRCRARYRRVFETFGIEMYPSCPGTPTLISSPSN